MPYFESSLIVGIICISASLLITHIYSNKSSIPLKILISFLAILSIFLFSNFGNLHIVKNSNPEFVEQTGSQVKRSYFHWHEIYHYYLGAKYYPELGHYGLYNTVALADSLSNNPQITTPYARDLSNPSSTISYADVLAKARDVYRPKFSDERWAEFTQDIAYMKSIAIDGWLNVGMLDAGFNPPPTWTVFGYTIANILPLSSSWFDYGPMWDQSEFLPLLDLILLIIACYFIYRRFGLVGLALFIIAFGTSIISSPRWNSGAFLRYIWLFGVIMGICMVKQQQYFKAGIFLGLAALVRIFPLVFIAGVAIALFFRYRSGENPFDDLRKFVYGVATISGIILPISFIMFGYDLWYESLANIFEHKNINFVGHIAYKKFATFDPLLAGQNFWGNGGLERFAAWSDGINEIWAEMRAFHLPFIIIFVGTVTWVMRKISIEEGALLFGFTIMYFFEMPANYYYVFMCLIPVVALSNATEGEENQWKDIALACVFLLMWAAIYYIPTTIRDDIVYTYYFSYAFLLFFLFWVMLRLLNIGDLRAALDDHALQKDK